MSNGVFEEKASVARLGARRSWRGPQKRPHKAALPMRRSTASSIILSGNRFTSKGNNKPGTEFPAHESAGSLMDRVPNGETFRMHGVLHPDRVPKRPPSRNIFQLRFSKRIYRLRYPSTRLAGSGPSFSEFRISRLTESSADRVQRPSIPLNVQQCHAGLPQPDGCRQTQWTRGSGFVDCHCDGDPFIAMVEESSSLAAPGFSRSLHQRQVRRPVPALPAGGVRRRRKRSRRAGGVGR